ncbi:MAG: ABC transporter ATP-binding protein/permease [Deltaproteobacteria bacterium]|jgi:ABC-type multidrug transport system fused ATPase/permease subunit|nr:ABC transporter ATP-binding protein/permease [Deltaproteobacteria bacterium]
MTLPELFHCIRPFIRPYRRLVLLALFLTLVGAFTAQVNAWVLRYATDEIRDILTAEGGRNGRQGFLALISAILLGKELLNLFIQFGQKYYAEKLRIYISRDLAQAVIEKILTYKLAFYSSGGNQPGLLQTRIDRGVESLTRLVQNFFIDILPLFATSIVAVLMMFSANFHTGFLGFCAIPIYYYVSRLQAGKLTPARRRIKSLRENKSQGILSILESIPVIKSFLREDIEEKKQLALQTDLTDAQLKIRRTGFLFDGLKGFIEQIGLVLIIILTSYFVLQGEMSIGSIMFNILLFNNASAPIRRLHLLYDQMNDALIYAEGFFEIMRSDHQVERSGVYIPPRLTGGFELKEVSFTYPGNASPTLDRISMTILPGKITALVGLSGAGKSTLVNLLDKFYVPDSGEILLDGKPLAEYDTAFIRGNIGLVLQKNHIFNGTVAENIRYGNPSASLAEVEEAAALAGIHEQILALPRRYATPALNLSGGQQQKIALARMFLKNPPIIFLDEPTASLDAVAAEQIKNALDAVKKNRTVVIISHSLAQIVDADCIYVLKEGRIAESGNHDFLYRRNGVYREIFDALARSLNMDKIARTLEE